MFFQYPAFHLLNKQGRVALSQPHKVNSVFPYRLLAIANSKGWFAAVRRESRGACTYSTIFNTEPHLTFFLAIALSTLQELRASLKNAKENDENLFVPHRLVELPAEDVNIIAFGMHDTRLLVGFTGGQLLVYDTAHLFTAGANDVAPLSMAQTSSSPFVQIVPNPGTEPDLAQLVATIRGDGVVQVLDINKLESRCGWAGEGEAVPVASMCSGFLDEPEAHRYSQYRGHQRESFWLSACAWEISSLMHCPTILFLISRSRQPRMAILSPSTGSDQLLSLRQPIHQRFQSPLMLHYTLFMSMSKARLAIISA